MWSCSRFSSRAVRWSGSILFGSALAAGCTTDHEQLARRPRTDASTDVESERIEFDGTGGSDDAGLDVSDSEVLRSADRLTLMHGMLDSSRIAFCVSTVSDSFSGMPFPAAGLGYGQALRLSELPGIDVEHDAIDVLAVDLDRTPSIDCAAAAASANAELGNLADAADSSDASDADASVEADATASAGRAATLVRLPGGTLFGARQSLLVAQGCFSKHHGGQSSPCDGSWQPPSAMVVALTAAEDARSVALTAVNAWLDGTTVDVFIRAMSRSVAVASSLAPGQVEPRQAKTTILASALASSSIELRSAGTDSVLLEWPVSKILTQSSDVKLLDGNSYALVALGTRPKTPESQLGFAALSLVAIQ